MGLVADINEDDFKAVDWKKVIDNLPDEERECRNYTLPFMQAARDADSKGDDKAQQIFALLGAVSSLRPQLDTPEDPFGPQYNGVRSRTAVLNDFDDETLDFLTAIIDEVKNPELYARIAEIVWILRRDFKLVPKAVNAHLASAKRLEDPEHWVATFERIERAAQLAVMSGRNGTAFPKVIRHIEDLLIELNGEDPLFLSARLMALLHDTQEGDPSVYAPLAEKLALRAEKKENWDLAREYWSLKAAWHHKAEEASLERDAKLAEAETYVKESQAALERPSLPYTYAAMNLQQAIEAFRRVGNTKERVQEVRAKLLEYQAEAVKELIPTRVGGDATELAQNARDSVKDKTLHEAVLALAFITSVQSKGVLKSLAEEAREKYLFQRLFPKVYHNALGRVIARQPQNEDEALLADMFEYANWSHNTIVQAVIEPARHQILQEHYVRLGDFKSFVHNHPFVQPGREAIIARGLHAGINGDFLVAAHLLIPQLEASLRFLLSHMGVITSGFDKDGIQEEYGINRLLTEPEFVEPLEKVLGEDMVFDLRGLLVERFGANLRNDTAHGLLGFNSFYSSPSCYLWWLSLRLYAAPVAAGLTRGD